MRLSNRVYKFEEYIFSSLAKKKAEAEKRTGKKVLDLSIGMPDFPPNPILLAKLKEFLGQSDSHLYPGYRPMPELVTAVRHWFRKRFNVELEKDEILHLNGSKDGISHLALAMLNPGDEVLVPDPGYPGFAGPAKLIGAKVIGYRLRESDQFKVNLEVLAKKINRRTKMIWVNFPANPTGQAASLSDLEELVAFVKTRNIFLAYDNAYSEISFNGYKPPSILQVKGARDFCVELGSFSKTFSLAGFRLGWMVGNRSMISGLAKIKSQFDSGTSIPLQRLAAFALSHFDQAWHRKMIAGYQKRQKIVSLYLRKIGLRFEKASAGLYLWAKIPDKFSDSEQFADWLLKEKQVLLAPGAAFGQGGKRFVRVSFSGNIDNISSYFKL